MIVFGMVVLFLVLPTLGFAVGVKVALRYLTPIPVSSFPVPIVPPSVELQAALQRIEVLTERVAFLEQVEVVPATPYTALPWQLVPSPARTFWVQGILDDVQDLRAEVQRLEDLVAWKDSLRARYLARWKSAQRRLKAMVPVESFEAVEDLRTRSLTVAKSASSRAAELSTALTELEVARFESLTLDQFNAECDLILDRHQLPVQFPARERQAA